MKPNHRLKGLALCGALLAGHSAHAAINFYDDPELTFFAWDPVAKVSYSRDLGIKAKEFFNYAQSDAGYQNFWQLATAADSNFAEFRRVSASPADVRWAVMAADVDPGIDANLPGELNIFTTLTVGREGGLGVALGEFTSRKAQDFLTDQGAIALGLQTLSTSPGPFNSHSAIEGGFDYTVNGSSYDVEGTENYFDKSVMFSTLNGTVPSGLSNPLGQSSWFYYGTRADDFDGQRPIAVDEFDNLSHDGYWGLALDPSTSNYVLSYTLQAHTFTPSTAAGLVRTLLTERAASIGNTLIDAPLGDFAGYVPAALGPVAAVPEPAAGFMAVAGLLGLWGTRRRAARRG